MSRRRILIIDRQGVARDALARLLESEGHDVRAAGSAEALERLREFGPDAIVYDAKSIGDAGLRLEEAAAGNTMMMIELKVGAERRVPGADDGGRVVLPRPVNLEDLRHALRDH